MQAGQLWHLWLVRSALLRSGRKLHSGRWPSMHALAPLGVKPTHQPGACIEGAILGTRATHNVPAPAALQPEHKPATGGQVDEGLLESGWLYRSRHWITTHRGIYIRIYPSACTLLVQAQALLRHCRDMSRATCSS